MASTIEIIIDASTAQASRNLKSLTGDIDDLGDEAERTNKRMSSLKKTFAIGFAAAGVAAAASVVVVGKAMASSVRAGADAEEMLSKFNVVFADTAGTAEKVTSEMDAFAQQSGRNKYVLREMASGFGDVLKPLGFSVEEAGGLSTQMTQLAIDLGSFNNMRPEEAFERLSSTLVGNHANALAFGVVINEAVLKEELAAMGADELTGSLLEQAKVQARINLLMRGTTDAQGDAIRTSDSWTNQMLRLNSILDETKTTIGLKLLPVLTPFLEMAGNIAAEWGPKLADAIGGFIDNIDQEQLKRDIDTFFDNLLVGDLKLPGVEISVVPQDNNWFTFNADGGVKFRFEVAEKQTIRFKDFFNFEKLTGENGEAYTIIEAFGITEDFVTIDGVRVRHRLQIGDALSSDWSIEDGLIKLQVGSIEFTGGNEKKIKIGDLFEGDFIVNEPGGGFQLTGLTIGAVEVTDEPISWEDLLGDAENGLTFDGNTITGLKLGKFEIAEKTTWEDILGDAENGLTFDGNTITGLKLGKFEITEKTTWAELFGEDGPTWLSNPTTDWTAPTWLSNPMETWTAPAWLSNPMDTWGVPAWLDEEEGWGDSEWLQSLLNYEIPVPQDLTSWTWPSLPTWEWPDYLTWTWPEYKAWTWPSAPKWWTNLTDALNNFNPFGGGGDNSDGDAGGGFQPPDPASVGADYGGMTDPNENRPPPRKATGTSFFRGGLSWVGETGPELVALPRGAQIFPAGASSRMAAAGAGGVTINVNATVSNEMNAHVLARQVADILRRGGY